MDPEDRHQALIEKSENLTLAAAGSSRRGGGGGGRGGRGGKVGAAPAGSVQNREVLISKALSKLLRHDAEKEGVAIDEEGYVAVHEVVSYIRAFICVFRHLGYCVWEMQNWGHARQCY